MSEIISVKDCKDLLSNKLSCLKDGYEKDRLINAYRTLDTSVSLGEMFALAKQLIEELDNYDGSYVEGDKFTAEQQLTYAKLMSPFYRYEYITVDEYTWLLKHAGLDVTLAIIENRHFPIHLFIEVSFLGRHFGAPSFGVLQRAIANVKQNRKSEIIDYYRNQIPNSEHMSDEMVLSVAGVSI